MYEYETKNKIPLLLALSTCPRCMRMKKFLRAYKVEAKIVDVDLLSSSDRKATFKFLLPLNPRLSFPTLVVGEFAVFGEDYAGVKELLGL